MTRSIPTRIVVIDLNGDSYADRMYAADIGGQIWRFDILNDSVPGKLVAGGVIAQLGPEGMNSPSSGDTRRFYAAPDVAMFTDHSQQRRFISISIGSGYRSHPLDNSAADALYSIRDPHVFDTLTQAQYNTYPIIRPDDLVEVQGKKDVVIPKNKGGWKFTLPPTQKVLVEARTFDDSVYFVSFEPEVSSADPCQAGLSVNRVYKMSVVNGNPVFADSSSAADPKTPEEIDNARVVELSQRGIAPVPVFYFPSAANENCTGAECRPEPIACIGVECIDPDFNSRPIRTLWTQDGID
jgi:type IV pilus assembly protein PilY1